MAARLGEHLINWRGWGRTPLLLESIGVALAWPLVRTICQQPQHAAAFTPLQGWDLLTRADTLWGNRQGQTLVGNAQKRRTWGCWRMRSLM